jgi:large subunit ribosomal protein L25
MEQLTLTVETRQTIGKGAARKIRRAGRLPGVLYGLGHQANIIVEPRNIQKLLLEEGGRNKVLNLTGGGVDGRHAIVKDFQIDPLSRVLLHVDLLEIDVKKKIQVTVPLNFVGKSLGVAEGGVLNVVNREIDVKALPTQIPKHIDVDVSALKIGDSIHLDDVTLPEGCEKGNLMNPTLVTVVPPTKEEEAVAVLAPTAEPEVITEKKAEGEEGAAAQTGADKEKKDDKKK